jgi:hypothetical protein
MLIQAPGSAFSGSRGQSVGEEKTNTAIPADCFSAVRTTLRSGHGPMIVSLGGKLAGIQMELSRCHWRCIDARSGAVLIT